MFTSNSIDICGDPDQIYDRIYQLAADIQDWPSLLPHYRYLRVLERSEHHKVADFGASRSFLLYSRFKRSVPKADPAKIGTLWRLGFPCRWRARQELFPDEGRITYIHIGGITRGMRVEWRLERRGDHVHAAIDHELNYPVPILGPLFARYIVGNLFVHNIAGKTLRCIKAQVESEQATP